LFGRKTLRGKRGKAKKDCAAKNKGFGRQVVPESESTRRAKEKTKQLKAKAGQNGKIDRETSSTHFLGFFGGGWKGFCGRGPVEKEGEKGW